MALLLSIEVAEFTRALIGEVEIRIVRFVFRDA
jgi:hypothetical protein